MSDQAFDFIIGGIEDGMIDALWQAVGRRKVDDIDVGYVKKIDSYGGELDSAKLREALSSLTPQLPLMLVSYADGDDTLDPAVVSHNGSPRFYRHDCTFTVICCSGNARGEKARRRGATGAVGIYKMISDVRTVLGGLGIMAVLGTDSFLLNSEPLRFAGVEYITRLTDLTAYAVHFETWFRLGEPDRSQPGQLVHEVVFDVQNTFEKGESNLPGVFLG
ncbi:MAG: phage protein Gp37 [Blastocatellia bacterium]